MKTALIKSLIWKDDLVFKLNIDTKLLLIFLSTCPERNTTRFFQCPDRLISAYIGISDKALELCKRQLEELGMVYFFEGWIIIGNFSYVQPTKGKLSQTIYNQDIINTPDNIKAYAESLGLELSTEESSGATPEYKDKDKNKDKNKDKDVILKKSSEVQKVFDAWVQSTGKNKRTVLDDKRKRIISTALKNYSVDELILAVTGWQHSPWHRGENPNKTRYNDLGLLLRDAGKIESFIAFHANNQEKGKDIQEFLDQMAKRQEIEKRAARKLEANA